MRTEREIKDRLAVILDSIIDDNNDIAYLIKTGAKYASIAILRWVLWENVKNSISKTLDDIDIDLLYRN